MKINAENHPLLSLPYHQPINTTSMPYYFHLKALYAPGNQLSCSKKNYTKLSIFMFYSYLPPSFTVLDNEILFLGRAKTYIGILTRN